MVFPFQYPVIETSNNGSRLLLIMNELVEFVDRGNQIMRGKKKIA